MLALIRDKWAAVRAKAQYERAVQERLLRMVERTGPQPVADEPGWWPLGQTGTTVDETQRIDLRTRARQLVLHNPHARNVLRLLEIYVVGPGLSLAHVPRSSSPHLSKGGPGGVNSTQDVPTLADRFWREFLTANASHFSYREFARRTWRDGECFLRLFSQSAWPPSVRFVDPETIDDPQHEEGSQGIVTDPHDVETPLLYLRIDPESSELVGEIPADEMLHVKIGVDSNQKRGVTIFAPVVETLSRFDKWLEGELLARRLQASIVLWRRVNGSPSQVAGFADAAGGDAGTDATGTRRERMRPGTIVTTSQGTDLKFLQPDTNFADAMPLGRLLLLSIAAGEGIPEFMLTSDASNGNFASTMVAEGPAVKLFEAEQEFFVAAFDRLWRRVMDEAVRLGLLPETFFDEVGTQWTTPDLVSRDRPRERLADIRLVESGILSKSEVARRDGMDPDAMRKEIATEREP